MCDAHPELPIAPALDALVLSLLERDPKLRPANAQAVTDELGRLVH
jgi:hypothetical protein